MTLIIHEDSRSNIFRERNLAAAPEEEAESPNGSALSVKRCHQEHPPSHHRHRYPMNPTGIGNMLQIGEARPEEED